MIAVKEDMKTVGVKDTMDRVRRRQMKKKPKEEEGDSNIELSVFLYFHSLQPHCVIFLYKHR